MAWHDFISGLPPEEQRAVGMVAPAVPNELTEALEHALATLELNRGKDTPLLKALWKVTQPLQLTSSSL